MLCFDYFSLDKCLESSFKKKKSKMNFIEIVKVDLDSPRRELSNDGLGIVVALLVRWQKKCRFILEVLSSCSQLFCASSPPRVSPRWQSLLLLHWPSFFVSSSAFFFFVSCKYERQKIKYSQEDKRRMVCACHIFLFL